MADVLKLSILSPERRLLEDEDSTEVTLTTTEGQIQILPGHAPMIGTLETGIFSYKTRDSAIHYGIITAGFFEVAQDRVKIMAETIELKGEVDLDRARRAQKLAEDALQDANLDEHKFRKYQLKLERAIVRQQLVARDNASA